ncbi:MAG TPA: TIGR03560 family F420-dependent LLM class oxidoreductase, partial [Phototrophicaceae bacterium]|nr:TIGR03560 family F420-dependent LLM class oxidoreductase [Phototrophicaceae bacterium]
EAWSVMAGLARDTSRIKLGQMVTCNGYRNPALLAKLASTVDVMSHGRVICGLGAGWYEHEWKAYGYGFPDTPDRMRAFREACEIVVRMWTDEKATFQGKYYSIDGAINEPKGVQTPHIPLWIGGGGEQVTLKLVAQWGNGCNVGGGNLETVKQKLQVLRDHCNALGRNYDELIRSTNMNVVLLNPGDDPEKVTAPIRGKIPYEEYAKGAFVVTAQQLTDHIGQLMDLGINYLITYFPRVAYDHGFLEHFASDVMPHFA